MPLFSDITFYNNDRKVVLNLNSYSCGRQWHRIYLFMTSVCGHFKIEDYDIKQDGANEIMDINLTSLIPPGNYTITAKQSTSKEICISDIYSNLSIIPRSRRNSIESPSQSPRRNNFSMHVNARDQCTCVITGNTNYVQACHIVAIAYWNRKDSLPNDTRRVIESLPNKINDVRNGLILTPDFHHAFDAGDIAIKYEADTKTYTVVAINIEYQAHDGQLLWVTPSSSRFQPPHPALLDFHIALSLMKNLRAAAAEYDENFDDPGSDFCIPQMQLVEAF